MLAVYNALFDRMNWIMLWKMGLNYSTCSIYEVLRCTLYWLACYVLKIEVVYPSPQDVILASPITIPHSSSWKLIFLTGEINGDVIEPPQLIPQSVCPLKSEKFSKERPTVDPNILRRIWNGCTEKFVGHLGKEAWCARRKYYLLWEANPYLVEWLPMKWL